METPISDSGVIVMRRTEYSFDRARELSAELSAIGFGSWSLDFRNVNYIDSCCLGELIRALKRMQSRDPSAQIRIVNASPLVQRIFAMTCLDTLFHIEDAGT